MKQILVVAVSLASLAVAHAQTPPATEVFLAPLTISADAVTVGTPVNISNNPGYDNQPSFLPNSSGVLFTSNRDGKQNDIYRWDIASKQLVQLTHTPENEYSPLVSPDGKSFVCVHGTEQSLFRYDLDGSNPRLAYQHGKELIGYHVWITDTKIAAFILGSGGAPATLQVIDTKTGAHETVASGIGRSLLMRPGRNAVSFVTKVSPQASAIKQFDLTMHVVSTVVADTLRASEDLAWLPDGGRLLMGQGQTLSVWVEGQGWSDVADFAPAGITKLTRLAVSPDGKWLAIVAEAAK
jgi:WD40 repeat protein